MPETTTETPAAPAATPAVDPIPSVGALAAFLENLLGTQGSLRRLLISLPGVVLLALNHKIGLNLDVTEQGIIAGVIAVVVTGSNLKEAAVVKAQAVAPEEKS